MITVHNMASYDTMTFQFHSSLQDEDFENNDGYDHHSHNLSCLSGCSSSSLCCDVDDAMAIYMSGLSIEEDDGDADAELSDDKELLLSSDSDENELSSRYPSPATPPRGVKDYVGGNEAQKTKEKGSWRKRCRRMRKGTRGWEKNRSKSEKKEKEQVMKLKGLSNGESDENGLRVTTKGGKSLCMELEEVKECRDLGFDLELEIPSPLSLSFSNSTLDTSGGSTSPITNWRISSPGDDPREVKARLQMWAQAVVASASRYCT